MSERNTRTYISSNAVLRQRVMVIEEALAAQSEGRPVSARALARACRIAGNAETRRRYTREAVTYARNEMGLKICADNAGYWKARNPGEWAAYLESRRAGARFAFVSVRAMSEAAEAAIGRQGVLFAGATRAAPA